MKSQLLKFTLLPFAFVLSACGTLPQNSQYSEGDNSPMVALPVATAVQVDYQDEVKLLRLNQLIVENKGDKKQKALLFYERGLIYDRMGLSAHSRYDFTQSIASDPSFSDAYNSLGIFLMVGQSYDEAFDAFDTALELSEDMQYSYLHRAIGLYQVKRYPLASRDINTFYELNKNDPYRILWRYIIDSQIDQQKALTALQNEKAENTDNSYAWGLIDVIAGRLTERSFFSSIGNGVTSNKEIAQRLCEVYFYLGHWHKISGNLDKAIYYFKLTTTTNIHEFIEYKYALMELASIQQELKEMLENTTSEL